MTDQQMKLIKSEFDRCERAKSELAVGDPRSDYWEGRKNGIWIVLSLLNLEIEGVK